MKFDNFVILACDRQATSFHIKEETTKYHKITDKIYCVGAGAVTEIEYLVTVLKDIAKTYELKFQKPITVKSLSSALSKYCYSKTYNNPFFGFELFCSLIVGGYVKEPELYLVDSVGDLLQPIENYFASGSGMELIYAYLDNNYNKKATKEKAMDIAYNAIKTATKRDVYSNISIDIVYIGKDKVEVVNKPLEEKKRKG